MNKRVCPCPFLGLIGLAVAIGLFSGSKCQPMDVRDWDLQKLISHLNEADLNLKPIPTRRDGQWGNSVYLSEDPAACWADFQTKRRNPDCIEQWNGSVCIERIGKNAATEWYVGEWGQNGFQLDRFVVFGDARIVERILQALQK